MYDVKVKRYATRGQFKANRNLIVESSEEEGQPGTKLRGYSFVFVEIYPHILFLSHSFSPLVGFQGNLTTLFPFVFILVIQRRSYGTCISNGWTWEMRK